MSPPAAARPARYGSRYGSPRGCAACGAALASARARFCSGACRQRAYRLRQGATVPTTTAPATDLAGRSRPAGSRVYECPECEARFLGERRCPDCNRFCRALGPGGACPHCDEPVLISELLGTPV